MWVLQCLLKNALHNDLKADGWNDRKNLETLIAYKNLKNPIP